MRTVQTESAIQQYNFELQMSRCEFRIIAAYAILANMKHLIIDSIDQIKVSPDDLILTANQRLALRTHQAYDNQQLTLNKTSWQTPNILPLTTWLNLLAAQHIQQVILSHLQELYLWESIISATCESNELINPSETASQAASAWKSLHLWQVEFSAIQHSENQEVALFYQWCLQFDALLRANKWISEAQIPLRLAKHGAKIVSPCMNQIMLLGFDEFAPAIHTLIATLEHTHEITSIQIEKKASSITQLHLHDQQAEMQAMAAWAKRQHENDPQAKIGCIVPQLETLRRKLYTLFSETFNPEQLLPAATLTEKKFNLSAGQCLSEYPVISSALHCLNWLSGRIDILHFGSALQSPYLHQCAQEQDEAARIDCLLRDCNEFELHFSALFEVASNLSLQTDLIRRLHVVNTKIKSVPTVATLDYWKSYFHALLDDIGWPGYRTLNSEEYQVYARFLQLLDVYTHYNLVCDERISLCQALYLLNKQAHNTIFQSEGSQANVQILGVLEASGNNFDFMWVMGLDDESWPAQPQPNPFIPYTLQKERGMPHATAERELTYTKHMMQRLCHSSKHIIFSAPQFDGDKHKSPSRLLNAFPHPESALIPIATTQPTEPPAFEHITDIMAPQLTDSETIRGGSWILKQQSECPFKAFAHIRLGALSFKQPEFGIAASVRGTLTHGVLERIWKQLGSQQQLQKRTESQLNTLISDSIEQALGEQHKPTDSALKQQLFAVEKKRLLGLLPEWLALEKQRPAFSVESLESVKHITVSRLRFSLRIDRIDTLDNGARIIIDYKTGTNSIAAWFGERPNDPQLPLYLCADTTLEGMAYAQVRGTNCCFKGVMSSGENAKQLPGSQSIDTLTKERINWSAQIKQWQTTVSHLVDEFESGLASVTPSNPATSCSYCDLHALCRVEMNAC